MKVLHLLAASALSAFAVASAFAFQYSQPVSADARMYAFTPSPGDAEFLRVFGTGGASIAPATNTPTGWDPAQQGWSYGFVQWNLNGFTPGVQYQVISAKLTLYHQSNPNWLSTGPNPPLELRTLGSNWDENIAFANPSNPRPDQLLTNATFPSVIPTGQDFAVTFDLSRAAFQTYLNNTLTSGNKISFALTSAMEPSATTRTPFYSLYAKEAPVTGVTPTLEIEAVAVPEPASIAALSLGALAVLKKRKRSDA